MALRILDSRRLTGSNLATRETGALVDVALDGADRARAVDAWRRAIGRVLPWPGELHVRHYAQGVALFVPGPLDVLMPLCDLNEWAVASASAELAGEPIADLDPQVLAELEAARVPGLVAMRAAARAHHVPCLVDDDAITLGAGRQILRFPRQGPIPAPEEIVWETLGHPPIAIVTGTNGKTTTTRMIARIARAAGLVPGITSSDGVAVDEQLIHPGDFSGPEGTRLVLRHPAIELAVLETARGGILRRGLTVEDPDVAVITNVTADHLGDYGVDDVATMAQVKAVIGRDARHVILNADDPVLVALASAAPFAGEVAWCSRRADAPLLAAHRRRGGTVWYVRDGQLVRADGPPDAPPHVLLPIAEIAVTFGGRATYNVENALAAAAAAHALGIPDAAIVRGLRSFTSSRDDNPGRGNVVERGGVTVLLDFGHNPAAVRAVVALARALLASKGGALHVTIGMPGDRDDVELAAVAHEIAGGAPAHVVVRELPEYLFRGRVAGEVPGLLVAALRRAGLAADAISLVRDEIEAVTRLLAMARPGDLVLVLVHLAPEVDALLLPPADGAIVLQ
ncbi:MAG: Mur ligase family protein [Proteobacteria bacterium]|nr:Mur ligase family protein [Pseudomonadota bacterium]